MHADCAHARWTERIGVDCVVGCGAVGLKRKGQLMPFQTEQTPEPLNLNDSTTQTSTATWDGPRTGERPQLLNRIQLAKWRRENHVAARADLNLNVEEEAGDCHSGDHGLDPEHLQVVQLKLQCT